MKSASRSSRASVPVAITRADCARTAADDGSVSRERSTLVQMQHGEFGRLQWVRAMLEHVPCDRRNGDSSERSSMYVVAAALLVLSGLFYSASHHEIGS